MNALSTTKMSSRGQVVIPEDIRKRLGLDAGEQFVVVAENDVVILKRIKAPSMRDFDSIIREASRQAKAVGLKRSDIKAALARVRSKR